MPEDSTRRHELLDGVYVVSPPPRFHHQEAVMNLYELLKPGLESRPDLLLRPTLGDIVVGPRSVVQPDLFVIPKPACADVQWRDVSLPLLVVEVLSQGTAARDRGIKRQLYQHAGIPEYWSVDLDSRMVERWRPADERPEIIQDRLSWSPPGSRIAVDIDLPEFFAALV